MKKPNKSERVFRVIRYLSDNPGAKASEIVAAFEVSERTVYRDVSFLLREEVVVRLGDGFALRNSTPVPHELSRKQQFLLWFAINTSLIAEIAPYDQEISDLIDKLQLRQIEAPQGNNATPIEISRSSSLKNIESSEETHNHSTIETFIRCLYEGKRFTIRFKDEKKNTQIKRIYSPDKLRWYGSKATLLVKDVATGMSASIESSKIKEILPIEH